MGKVYTQVTMEERCEIARLRALGSSVRQIAAGEGPAGAGRALRESPLQRGIGYAVYTTAGDGGDAPSRLAPLDSCLRRNDALGAQE